MSCSKDIRLVRKWIREEKSKMAPGKKGMSEPRKQKKGKGYLGFAVGKARGGAGRERRVRSHSLFNINKPTNRVNLCELPGARS